MPIPSPLASAVAIVEDTVVATEVAASDAATVATEKDTVAGRGPLTQSPNPKHLEDMVVAATVASAEATVASAEATEEASEDTEEDSEASEATRDTENRFSPVDLSFSLSHLYLIMCLDVIVPRVSTWTSDLDVTL